MGATLTPDHPHPVSLWRAALTGAFLAALLCLVFWATAAAQGLPAGAPAWVRTFQPAAGTARLVAGLFWTAVAGAVLSVLLAGAFNLARRATHRRQAH